MDLAFDDRHAQLQIEARAFLEEHWTTQRDQGVAATPDEIRDFRALAIERGYLYRHVPAAYGGSEQPEDPIADEIIENEFTVARAPQGIVGEGPDMVVPTLLQYGTEEQRQQFIAGTLVGDITWCQGYSEPSAGSDLASLKSRAELDGDEWVINGHKIWTTSAHHADWMFGLFRTEPDVPRHGGITFLLVPMDQPEIEVQQLRAMNGEVEFNEVFLDGARTNVSYTVGERGGGWAVSRNLLVHERNLMGFRSQQLFNSLIELARTTTRNGRPAIEDPGLRRELVEIEGYLMSTQYSRYRSITAASRGETADMRLAAVVKKLHTSTLFKRMVQVGLDLAGADEALRAPGGASVDLGGANDPGGWTANYLFAHAISIGGGAPNIQRNIIGEHGLGLPRDLREGATSK